MGADQEIHHCSKFLGGPALSPSVSFAATVTAAAVTASRRINIHIRFLLIEFLKGPGLAKQFVTKRKSNI